MFPATPVVIAETEPSPASMISGVAGLIPIAPALCSVISPSSALVLIDVPGSRLVIVPAASSVTWVNTSGVSPMMMLPPVPCASLGGGTHRALG